MSLIFEALKKEHASVSPLAQVVASGPFVSVASPRSGLAIALGVLIGMLLAGGGAWLYWCDRVSNLNLPVSALPAQVVPVPESIPVLSHSSIVLPSATAYSISKPIAVTVNEVAAVAAPTLAAKVLPPVVQAPVNAQVHVSTEASTFNVREAFQAFVQHLQSGRLPEAQIVADKISHEMGRRHVMSLRAQGYLALKKDDLNLARDQYFQLNQVLPEDREAGLNLALIDWRLGDKESATRRVAGLAEKFPGDSEIQALYLNVRNP